MAFLNTGVVGGDGGGGGDDLDKLVVATVGRARYCCPAGARHSDETSGGVLCFFVVAVYHAAA